MQMFAKGFRQEAAACWSARWKWSSAFGLGQTVETQVPKHSHNEIILRAKQVVGIVIFQRNLSFSFFAETGENVSRNLSIYRPFLEILFVLLLIKSANSGISLGDDYRSFFFFFFRNIPLKEFWYPDSFTVVEFDKFRDLGGVLLGKFGNSEISYHVAICISGIF